MRCIVFLFFILFMGCSPSVRKDIMVIDPRTFEKTKELYLSDIADSVFFIPLDNTKLFSGIEGKLWDSLIFIKKNAIFAYTYAGEYVRQYGTRGKGPNEYISCLDFEVDEKGSVYAADYRRNRILHYDPSGNYVGEIDCSDCLPEGNTLGNFVYAEGRFFLKGSLAHLKKPGYSWVVLDKEGNEVGKRLSEHEKGFRFDQSRLYKAGPYVCYWDTYSDTVFQIDRDGRYEVRYLWAKGDFRLPPEEFKIKLVGSRGIFPHPEAYIFFHFCESPREDIFVDYQHEGRLWYAFYKKAEGRWYYCAEAFQDDLSGYGYENGIFPYTVQYTSSGAFVLECISPLALKDWAGSKDFDRIQVKTPRFKQQLKELADGLEEEDNWVIVAYRLKE